MSKDNEKELKKKEKQEKEEKKVSSKKEEESKKKVEKEEKKESKKNSKKEEVEVVTEDSQIRKNVMILGSYVWEKIKDYRYVMGLDLVIFLLLFFLIPSVIFDVKPVVWMIGFVVFCILPTIGIYGMNKFREKQIIFGFFFIYLLIVLSLKRFTLIELYGITSQGNLDHTPAWLDAVFVTCIIVFFQYIGILIVNLVRKMKKKTKKRKK